MSKKNPCLSEQDAPHGAGADIADEVCKDIQARAELGKLRYGERLKAHNGRNALIDLYEEILDSAMYLKQYIEENGDAH